MTRPRGVYALIGVGVLTVSTSAVLVKLSEAPPVALAFWRVMLAWLVLLPVVLLRERRQLRTLPRRDALWAFCSGLFLASHYGVWFLSLRMTNVASSTVLVTTQPIWVLLIAYVLWRERVALRSLAGIAIALVGVYFIGSHGLAQGGGEFLGDVLAVAAAILVSGYLLIGQRIRARVPLFVYVFLVYGAAALGLGIFAWATKTPLIGYGAREWQLFAALAAVPTLFGHTVFNWALQYVPASLVSVGVLGEPVGAVVLALLLLGEVPAPVQIGAGALILVGIGVFLHFRAADTSATTGSKMKGPEMRGSEAAGSEVAGSETGGAQVTGSTVGNPTITRNGASTRTGGQARG